MRVRIAIAFILSVGGLTVHAATDGFSRVKSSGGVTEYRLESNGLCVLLAPIGEATSATFSVTYRVGSRDESYGTTGSAHLLEHLMFKGTPVHNKEAGNGLDQVLEGIGAQTNATTSYDRTNYVTTLSPEHLPVIMRMEADRMRNLRLREEDLRPEMQVVMDEFHLVEDDPISALDREIRATAFQAHPYRHAIIGWRSDVETVPLPKLREFYDTYYWPDNATVAITGSFGSEEAILGELNRHFGAIPRAPRPIPVVTTVEPAQTGPRRFEMKRAVDSGVVTIAFKSPAARHPDLPALRVLCDILADGRNSRFYHALTETGLALDTFAWPEETLDPSLLVITAELAEGSNHRKTEVGILKVLEEVIRNGVAAEDVKLAIARLSAQGRYAREDPAGLADGITESIAIGDWTHFQGREAALEKVTAEDVRRVAERWLREDARTIGWLRPDPAAVLAEPVLAKAEAPVVGPLLFPAMDSPADAVAKIADRVARSRTAELDLVVCPSGKSGVVRLTGSLPLGTPADQPLASFAAAMIERGTAKHDATQIGDLLDETGSMLEFEVRGGFLHISGRCLSEHLPRLLDVLAEQLREPSFPPNEVDSIRDQLISEAATAKSDTDAQAALAYNRALHPAGHPGRLPDVDETLARLKSISREDLVAFHREWFGPASALLVITGDVTPAATRALVESSFGGWAGGRSAPAMPAIPPLTAPESVAVPLPGKETVRVLLGLPCRISPADPAGPALSLASAALGSGFTSRLVHTVRDTEGLTYGVRSAVRFEPGGAAGWMVTASFSPDLLDRGLASIRREIGAWHRDGLGASEFAYHRSAVAGSWRVALATSGGLGEALHDSLRLGLSPAWLDEFPQRIGALTLEEVNAAIRQHLGPDRLLEVKCGGVR